MMKCKGLLILVLIAAYGFILHAQVTSAGIEKGGRVYIESMNGFENYLAAAILKKKVPLVIVDDKAKAEYIISGSSHLEKAGWAKTIFISPRPDADASIQMHDTKGNLKFAYSVNKASSVHGEQSTAEACAKHLKEAIEKP
jgi:hypothetical protein